MNECGVPPGVFNVVHGFGPDSAGQYLTEHLLIDAITFTGETRTGEAIMKAAAVGLRNISLECGGKNPGIVFADCDIEKAVEGTMRSRSEEHTSELQSRPHLVCRLLLEKKKHGETQLH